MPEFDAYLMVDWSASSRPVTGSDSVWYCVIIRTRDNFSVVALENRATRRRAVAEIKDILREFARREQMTLVGFDFPYGYPTGSAAALGLTDTPAWLSLWREIAARSTLALNRATALWTDWVAERVALAKSRTKFAETRSFTLDSRPVTRNCS